MNKALSIPAFIGLLMIIAFYIVSLTIQTVAIFIPGVIITYIFYVRTAFKNPPVPEKIVPLYLIALAIQFIHFAEEYVMDFHIAVPELLGTPGFSLDYWVIFNMVAYAFFVLGTIAFYKQIKIFMIIPLFFIVVGVMLNGIGHILISVYTGGYFPGLYTAPVYLIIGPIILRTIIEESKFSKPILH